MIKEEIEKLVKESIKELQKEKKLSDFELPEINVEHPEEKINGDYSTNIAMIIAGLAKKNPVEIANFLSENLKNKNQNFFEKIEAKNGFINFFLSNEYLQEQMNLILKEWKEHKNNYDKSGEWFECDQTETNVYTNYAVGASITTTYSNGEEKTIILKTKKQADAYSKKQKEKYGSCVVCNRFKRLLSQAKKETEKQGGGKGNE